MHQTQANKYNVLSVFGLGKMENLIMRINIFIQSTDLVLDKKLDDDRLEEFRIPSYT